MSKNDGTLNFRKANPEDLEELMALGLVSWSQYKEELTQENWHILYGSLSSTETFTELLRKSECIVCEDASKKIIGMAFLVPSGNPTEIYAKNWCHLRFVSVDPNCRGRKIGESLTRKCIEIALSNKENTMALHTSEMMKAARHIYEKIGFRVQKEIDQRFGVRYWLYTLDLLDAQVATLPL